MANRSSNPFVGVLLILVGLAFLIGQVSDVAYSWTFLLIGLGLAFLLRNVIEKRAVTVFPGVLLTLLGFVFFAEEQRWHILGVWDAWPWVPVVVGLAFFAEWLFNRERMGLLLTSAILLVVGGLFVAAESDRLDWGTVGDVLEWWPVILLVIGVWLLLRRPPKQDSDSFRPSSRQMDNARRGYTSKEQMEAEQRARGSND